MSSAFVFRLLTSSNVSKDFGLSVFTVIASVLAGEIFPVTGLSLLLQAPIKRVEDTKIVVTRRRVTGMSGFLSKLRSSPRSNRLTETSKQKLQFRDPDDPRLLYRISNRAQRISLRVNSSEREVIVTMPSRHALEKARSFAKAQNDWINVQLEALPAPQPFVPGGTILLYGDTYQLENPSARGRPEVIKDNHIVNIPAPIEAFSGRTRRLLIREARSELQAATQKYAEILGKEVEKVSVRDTRSRWGSCITRQGKGHISYSWRLISAPPFVLDYVAAHECAHMIEANHSADFWAIVDDICPDTKKAKAWLRKNGALLHAVGADY